MPGAPALAQDYGSTPMAPTAPALAPAPLPPTPGAVATSQIPAFVPLDGKPCDAPPADPGIAIDLKNGLGVKTKDGQFSMRINALIQADYRDFNFTAGDIHTGTALHDNFLLPRVRLFFRGNATEFIDYAVSTNSGLTPNALGNVPAPINLLDAYIDLNPLGAECKEYFQLRVGRFKTPYGIQFYKIAPQDWVTPELSMFSTNFTQNWEEGAMAHGELLDKRFEYAAGVFNGVPNGFEVSQNSRQGIFYASAMPFLLNEDSALKRLQIAASYAGGRQNSPALPNTLGTAAGSNGPPDNQIISPTFMAFNTTALNAGVHSLFEVDLNYSYKSFNFYGEYNTGRQQYATGAAPHTPIPVDVNGYSGTFTYFFTGEEISQYRARVKPLCPYNPRAGQFGAVEGFARYSELHMSENILTSGLLVATSNANRVQATDLGLHWYWNEYLRISFDWQHSWFNNPISTAPGNLAAKVVNSQDLLWVRWQLYY